MQMILRLQNGGCGRKGQMREHEYSSKPDSKDMAILLLKETLIEKATLIEIARKKENGLKTRVQELRNVRLTAIIPGDKMHLRLRKGESGRVWQMREQGYNLIQWGQERDDQTQVKAQTSSTARTWPFYESTDSERNNKERERGFKTL